MGLSHGLGPATEKTEAIAPFRGRVALATKLGSRPDPKGGPGWTGLDSRPEHLQRLVGR